ncbi:MAG TPA: hypothetical protein VEK13_07370 [Thermoplasmata archaeon]|nr:hypothetical protein [Thermoplasmata archaeon]
MIGSEDSAESAFLNGLKSQLGKRVQIWYNVELSESGAGRETVEGRLDSVKVEAVLTESRLIHPSLIDDHATRTASVDSIRGYHELDQRTGSVTRTVVRPKRSDV